ncbi:carbohydrate kinase family protein [Halovulum sp. GXIMD14793]
MILCCGEALIDMIPMQSVEGEPGFTPHSGGSVFNTAIALGRLEGQVGMFTGLSSDFLGRQLDAALRVSHVDTRFAVVSDRPTPLAFVQLSAGQASYTFYDDNSTVRMLGQSDLPDLTDEITALYFGGISLCQNPVGDALRSLCEMAAKNRVIVLDPNVRPNFVEDVDTYRTRLLAMISRADIVKVSDEDLNWIYPGTQSLEEKADALLSAGASVVILTRGHLGATAKTLSGQTAFAPVPKVAVVDTVGAGDTFNAGFIAKLQELGLLSKEALQNIQSASLEEALSFAARVAAINVSRAGANPPWLNEVETSS